MISSITSEPTAPAATPSTTAGGVDPRVARSRATVLEAARRLLVDGGPAALTVDGVVTASGVAKTTVYRHWPSQRELLVDVLRDCAPGVTEMVDAVEALEFEPALRALVRQVADMLADEEWRRVVPAVMLLKRQLSDVEDFEAEMRAANAVAIARVLDKGIAEGRVRPDADPMTLGLLVGGPLLMAALSDEQVPPGLVDAIVDNFLAGEAAHLAQR